MLLGQASQPAAAAFGDMFDLIPVVQQRKKKKMVCISNTSGKNQKKKSKRMKNIESEKSFVKCNSYISKYYLYETKVIFIYFMQLL